MDAGSRRTAASTLLALALVAVAARPAAAEGLRELLDAVGIAAPAAPAPTVPQPPETPVDATRPLGLLAAWRAAVANAPDLKAARAALASGRERVPQARSQLLPSVQASASRFHNDLDSQSVNFLGRPVSLQDRYYSSNQTVGVRLPLIREPQRAQLRQARHLERNAEATLQREAQDLSVRVTGAFLEACLARDQLTLVVAQQQFLQAQLEAARQGLLKGTGTRTDVDEAQARLDLNLSQGLEARQQVDGTRRQLEALLRRPFAELERLDPQRLAAAVPVPASAEAWVELATRTSPELLGLAAQLDAAREEIARNRAGHLPTLDAVAQWQRSHSENVVAPKSEYSNTSVGLQLTIPIYAGGSVASGARQAHAEYERIAQALEAARLDLGVRVQREYRGITEGLARVRALEAALRSAGQAVESARRSLAAGLRTTLDVLNAEQRRVEVQRDLAQARYVTLVSVVRLHALAGGVDEALVARLAGAFAP